MVGCQIFKIYAIWAILVAMILLLIANILGISLFLFILWKKLRDDYLSQQIFSTGFFIATLIMVLKITYYLLNYPDNIFIIILILAISAIVAIRRFRFNTLEFTDSLVISFLSWHAISQLAYILKLDLQAALELLASCILIFVFLFLQPRYKSFNFYKSGKIGFCGMAVISLYFLYRTAIAMISDDMLFFSKFVDLSIALTVFLVSTLTTINLSAKKV